jgi:hypothetical protein
MRFRCVFLSMLAAGALWGALAGSAQGASGPRYGLSGGYAPSCSTDVCFGGVDTYDWSGTAECIANCEGVPQSGSFSIHLKGTVGRFPPSPCVSKRVTGTFTASWSDATFTTASLSGRSRDGNSYRLRGVTDASSTAYPSDPIRGSVAYPTDPIKPNQRNACSAGTVSYPTDPMVAAFG